MTEVSCEHCGLPTDSPRVCFECGCGMCEDCTIEHDNAGHKHWCQNVDREKPPVSPDSGIQAAQPDCRSLSFKGVANLLTRLELYTIADALGQYIDNQAEWDEGDVGTPDWKAAAEERERAACAQAMLDVLDAKMQEAAEPKP